MTFSKGKIGIKGIIFLLCLNFTFISIGLYNPSMAYPKEKVTLQLRWDHQFQFAGYYAAQWMGYYEEEGLEVDILPAINEDGKIRYAPEEVAEGRADFGIGAVDILIANNHGRELTVVASIFQRSPVEFFMLENTPFNSIVDLVYLNTARRENDLLDIELQAMLISEGIHSYHLPLLDEGLNFSVEDLTTGKFDVIAGYLGTISYHAEQKGVGIKVIKPIDYGIDFYGDSLFTRRDLANKNPLLVEKFRRASLKGWQYALENPDEIIQQIVEISKETSKETAKELHEYNRFQAERVLGYTLYPVVEIGNVNTHRWAAMEKTLLKLNLMEEKIDWEGFVFDYEKILNAKRTKIESLLFIFSITIVIIFLSMLLVHITSQKTLKRLEGMVQKELKENQKKEVLILHQARLAAMGEMIANIAHQWRQPLNNLGLILYNIEDAHKYNELDEDYLHNSIERSRKLILKMSDTIDDFRYFLSPQNHKEYFNIEETIKTVIDLLEENLKFNNIEIKLHSEVDCQAYGYGNQFQQAIFNVISNSIDALNDKKLIKKEINITIDCQSNGVMVNILDNGGGVDPEIIDRIFDIYFTTKHEKKGTGLGLYITKTIIENKMEGTIHWQNLNDGLLMKITIPRQGGDTNGKDGSR